MATTKEIRHRYYLKHRDERLAYSKKYYREHKEKLTDYKRKCRAENRERVREYTREYYKQHAKKIQSQHKTKREMKGIQTPSVTWGIKEPQAVKIGNLCFACDDKTSLLSILSYYKQRINNKITRAKELLNQLQQVLTDIERI